MRYSHKVLAAVVIVSMFGFYFSFIDNSQAAQVSSRSDTMNNSNLSTTSNHTVQFTINDSLVDTSGATPSATGMSFVITFPAGFDLKTLTCADVSLATGAYPGTATGISTGANGIGLGDAKTFNTSCYPSSTSWGLIIASTTRTLTIFTPTSTNVTTPYIATGTQVIVKIGLNATDNPGQVALPRNTIVNPSSSNQYNVTVAGGFSNSETQLWPGTGTMPVFIISGVQVSATVAETLTFIIAGLPGQPWGGTNVMSGCDTSAPFTTDDDDGSTNLVVVTTTATTVPFGTITSNNTYQGCQRLGIITNAANGYTISQRSSTPLKTAGGATIPDTTCDGGGCTPYIGAAWTNIAAQGLGVSCKNSATSDTCSGTGPAGTLSGEGNPKFQSGNDVAGGVNFVPFAAETAGFSSSTRFAVTSVAPWVTSTEVHVKAKYRLRILASQPAGVFTNVVSWIATGIFN